MRSQRITDIVQIITGIAVLAGIGLVVFELRQSRSLTQADIVAQQFSVGLQFSSSVLGEELAAVLAKDCNDIPLTMEDALILDEYIWGLYHSFNMLRVSNYYGDINVTWEPLAERVFAEIFSMRSGQIWWSYAKMGMAPDIVKVAERAKLSELIDCKTRMQLYLNPEIPVDA